MANHNAWAWRSRVCILNDGTGITLVAALSLNACIFVEDLDEAWNIAMMDPALEGSWKKASDRRVPQATLANHRRHLEFRQILAVIPLRRSRASF